MRYKIIARFNHTWFEIHFKKFGIWWDSYIWLGSYFSTKYNTHEEALKAIEGYKNRITEID